MSNSNDFSWVGSQENFVDQPHVFQLNHISIGRYGGNSKAGQYKNEDGCLVWYDETQDWEFIILLDAHNTSESAQIILEAFENEKSTLKNLLHLPVNPNFFNKIEVKILNMFQSADFLAKCRKVKGETACLLVIRKDKYVWWFSVGDCIICLFHPELAALGQYQLNQRQFYEWIGQVNTFEQDIPCYTVGKRELRKGENHLFLTTDGLTECPNEPYVNMVEVYNDLNNLDEERSIREMLSNIQNNNVRDSTTIISWKINISKTATIPSNQ